MVDKDKEKRREKRVHKPYIIRYRQIKPFFVDRWDMATSVDVSKSGICFHTSYQIEVGGELELKLSNPLFNQEGFLLCTVIRSKPSKKVKSSFDTVVRIDKINDEFKECFNNELEQYIEKEKED